jgi:hypothetical protein
MKSATIVVAGGAAAALTASLHAGQWTLVYEGLASGRDVGVSYVAGAAWDADRVEAFSLVSAGVHAWSSGGASVSTIATQLQQTVMLGDSVGYDVALLPEVPDGSPARSPIGSIRAALLSDLYARYYVDMLGSGDDDYAAAFQLAVWEITHEALDATVIDVAQTRLDLTIGALQGSDDGASFVPYIFAQQMLFSLGFDGWLQFDGLGGLVNPMGQDQLAIVPLPLPAALAGLGLLGAGLLRRRLR